MDLCYWAVRHGVLTDCYRIKGETSANENHDRYRYRTQLLKGKRGPRRRIDWWLWGAENSSQRLYVASLIGLIRQLGELFATYPVLLVNCQIRMNALLNSNP
jgi:hypothetical protein